MTSPSMKETYTQGSQSMAVNIKEGPGDRDCASKNLYQLKVSETITAKEIDHTGNKYHVAERLLVGGEESKGTKYLNKGGRGKNARPCEKDCVPCVIQIDRQQMDTPNMSLERRVRRKVTP